MGTEPISKNEEFELDDDALERATGGNGEPSYGADPNSFGNRDPYTVGGNQYNMSYSTTFVPFDSTF
jgi:hypothetical protein